jgi:hypothetical protein
LTDKRIDVLRVIVSVGANYEPSNTAIYAERSTLHSPTIKMKGEGHEEQVVPVVPYVQQCVPYVVVSCLLLYCALVLLLWATIGGISFYVTSSIMPDAEAV